MTVQNLKNYGKPLNEISSTMPDDVNAKARKMMLKIILQRLGLFKMARFIFLMHRETKRLSQIPLTEIREYGLIDEAFIADAIERAASFSAMEKLVGREKAIEINNEIAETVFQVIMGVSFPKQSEIKKLDDPFAAFKDYLMAFWAADKAAGIHDFELAEDTDKTIQVNCTYCAYMQIPKALGIPEACLPSCYSDDIFFPKMCDELGVTYIRKGTLARGDKMCDFRFELNN